MEKTKPKKKHIPLLSGPKKSSGFPSPKRVLTHKVSPLFQFVMWLLSSSLWTRKLGSQFFFYLTHDTLNHPCHTRVSNSSFFVLQTGGERSKSIFERKIFTQNVITYGSLASWENWAAGRRVRVNGKKFECGLGRVRDLCEWRNGGNKNKFCDMISMEILLARIF